MNLTQIKLSKSEIERQQEEKKNQEQMVLRKKLQDALLVLNQQNEEIKQEIEKTQQKVAPSTSLFGFQFPSYDDLKFGSNMIGNCAIQL